MKDSDVKRCKRCRHWHYGGRCGMFGEVKPNCRIAYQGGQWELERKKDKREIQKRVMSHDCRDVFGGIE